MEMEMIIYKRGFEKTHFDSIAVVYEITREINRDGIEIVTKKAIHVHPIYGRYMLYRDKEYLIICGLSEYVVKNNEINRTFLSKKHKLFGLE
jgi:hypothetical protein